MITPGRQRGAALIVVLPLMVIIGMMSVASLRGAVSGEKLTNNIRLNKLAQQYAELALSYCEAELVKVSADRVQTLRDANIVDTAINPVDDAWELAATWTGTGGASASRTVVPEVIAQSTDSSVRPGRRPECAVERKTITNANGNGNGNGNTQANAQAYVVTARGFSPDYVADANGKTKRGSVVWLQSILPDAAAAPSQSQSSQNPQTMETNRIWRRIINPPIP